MKYNIALVGATGNIGREILIILNESKIPIKKIFVIASYKSVGKKITFRGKIIRVRAINDFDFHEIDLVFFATNSHISKQYIPIVKSKVKLVIDLSSYYRMNHEVPLIVPEVNFSSINFTKTSYLIANPNCVAILLAVALNPLHKMLAISRIIISTYQSVSGAGRKAMDTLYLQTRSQLMNSFIKENQESNIAFNIIPNINELNDDGYTKEEHKVMEETKKILSKDINITCTCVRVPVFIGHSISANVEFLQDISVDAAYRILNESKGIKTDKYTEHKYFTPKDCVGKNEVLISRIRQDHAANNILNLWIVADNLKKGAALNAIQVAEQYIKHL